MADIFFRYGEFDYFADEMADYIELPSGIVLEILGWTDSYPFTPLGIKKIEDPIMLARIKLKAKILEARAKI
ncbi:MAG: hypothetical protein V4438_01960 [Patescibacteria group bacterium]